MELICEYEGCDVKRAANTWDAIIRLMEMHERGVHGGGRMRRRKRRERRRRERRRRIRKGKRRELRQRSPILKNLRQGKSSEGR